MGPGREWGARNYSLGDGLGAHREVSIRQPARIRNQNPVLVNSKETRTLTHRHKTTKKTKEAEKK